MYHEIMNQKGLAPLLIIVGIALVLGIAGGAYYLRTLNPMENQTSSKENNTEYQVPIPSPSPLPVPSASMMNPVPSPSMVSKIYTVPSNWKTWSYVSDEFSYKLPPDWVSEGGGTLYYFRDAAFKPDRGGFTKEDFKGGSRRQLYISKFNDYNECEPQLTNNTSVVDETINGLSILKIFPINLDEPCHVTPAFVFEKNNSLYILTLLHGEGGRLDFWKETGYLDTYYKILSSIKFK